MTTNPSHASPSDSRLAKPQPAKPQPAKPQLAACVLNNARLLTPAWWLRFALITVTGLGISACGSAFFAASLVKQQSCPCEPGYTCIEDTCILAAALQLDDPCNQDDQCGADLICRDKYGPGCNAFDTNTNCTTGSQNQGPEGARCRAQCNPLQSWLEFCRPGEVCFSDVSGNTGSGFCQSGGCSGDTQCGANGLCIGNAINPNTAGDNGSGQCHRGCNPFNCTEGIACDDCAPEDVNGDGLDDLFACRPALLLAENISRTVCLPAGPIAAGGICSQSERCQPGSFCDFASLATTGGGTCRQYCRLSGGNPACNAGEICNGIVDQFADIGFCL